MRQMMGQMNKFKGMGGMGMPGMGMPGGMNLPFGKR
jgi:hypothetical protein